MILAADVAKECFDEIKNYLADSGDSSESKGKIIVATVKGVTYMTLERIL